MSRAENNKRAARAGLMASVAAAILFSTPAMAQERQRFNLSAGNAAQRVQTLAIQSRVQVIAPNEHLAGIRTRAINGDYTPLEALRQMLEGTGLEAVPGNGNTVVVRRASAGVALAADLPSDGQGSEASADEITQAEAARQREIVVTGSRIRRTGYDTLEAAIVDDREQIERRGYTNVIEALNETPGFVVQRTGGVNSIGTGQGTFTAGQNFADFFGLGSQRTLTLVNGRRFVSSNTVATGGASGQQVDLNVIPAGLIERIETIAIGGAPVYGSDAIAGTVNVILRTDYEGLRLSGQYGISEQGDYSGYTVRALGGLNFDEDRGNVAIGVEYNKQTGVRLLDRATTVTSYANPAGPPSFLLSENAVLRQVTLGGLPFRPGTFANIVNSAGQFVQFTNGGVLVPYVPGPRLTNSLNEGGDGIPQAFFQSLVSPTERLIVSGIGHYDLTPGVRVFAEVNYARSEGKEINDLAAIASPFITGTFASISINNPFISPEARATLLANGIPANGTFPLARDFSDVVGQDGSLFENTITLFRAVAGLEGEFALFGERARWDVSLNYGRSRGRLETTYIDTTRLNDALNTVRNASGQIVCASGNAACVPLDPFGPNSVSAAAAEYVTDNGRATSTNTQRMATANINGALPFRISTDPIAFNIGVEYRKETGEFDPDPLLRRDFNLLGLPLASGYVPQEGSFETREVYGELSVPLISPAMDFPVIDRLSLEGAVRYVDNSIAGGDLTWAAGGRLAPRLPGILNGLLFRGVYTQAIRAPAITELFSGASPTRGNIADPCDRLRFRTGPAPAVREANCRTALQALGTTPEAFVSTTQTGLSPIGTNSGNPDLENERAKSWSVGVVYQPPAIPGLRLAADWSDISLTNGIATLGIGALINACYDSSAFPNVATCDAFRRLASTEVGAGSANPVRVTGDIANGYRSGFVNTSSLDFAGLIISAEYSLPLQRLFGGAPASSRISFSAKLFHNDKFINRITDTSPILNQVGGIGLPDWSGQFNLVYADSHFSGSLQALWTGPVQNDITATPDLLAPEDNDIGNYWRFNASMGYRINEQLRLQMVVNNLFDRRLSQAELFSRAFSSYDLIGRRYLFSATIEY